ncbi:hypothetical protein GJ496_008308 [Pomphorhynchus laevis]|nr:hypothetical protein GJ496_008308 [Pomphorhynchus laevis]
METNLFHLSQCSASNMFVNVLASFYDSVANKAADEKSALKTAVTFCQLILQSVNSSKVSVTHWKKVYCRLLSRGKVQASRVVLEETFSSAVLKPASLLNGRLVREILKYMHPTAKIPDQKCVHIIKISSTYLVYGCSYVVRTKQMSFCTRHMELLKYPSHNRRADGMSSLQT